MIQAVRKKTPIGEFIYDAWNNKPIEPLKSCESYDRGIVIKSQRVVVSAYPIKNSVYNHIFLE